jgi:hypothetical protein
MMGNKLHFRRVQWMGAVGMALVCLLCGCWVPQVYSTASSKSISLGPDDLEKYGVAFTTPSTVTGQEEEKQSVAFAFAEVLMKERPAVRCITLPETLNAVNRAGLSEKYKLMYVEYSNTGIFSRDVLQQVGNATAARYVAQLKLSGFQQGTDGRFSAFGLRVIGTKTASLRLFFQIWDTNEGSIAWEGVEELQYSMDDMLEKSITLRKIMEVAARNMVSRLPKENVAVRP